MIYSLFSVGTRGKVTLFAVTVLVLAGEFNQFQVWITQHLVAITVGLIVVGLGILAYWAKTTPINNTEDTLDLRWLWFLPFAVILVDYLLFGFLVVDWTLGTLSRLLDRLIERISGEKMQMGIHPAPVTEFLVIAAAAGFFLSGSAIGRVVGVYLLGASLIFAIGVAIVYSRPPLKRH